ncbi:hypothetical protein [Chryseolinea lacunae]|uniref:hypothetical protein n=1 Tax=Chryseolinea lacunae TaxID=2801331 RepID=UPI001F48F68B|nr:hypothetical protein [Chryseolinea lacunae]
MRIQNWEIEGFQGPVADQFGDSFDFKLRFEEGFVFKQHHIGMKRTFRQKIRPIFPEERLTNFVIEMVLFVTQADNIDTVCPQPQYPFGR